LQLQAGKLLDASLSTNSKLAYESGIASFENFRKQFCLDKAWPPPLDHVIQFIAYLSIKKCSASTAKLYLSAISFECKTRGWQDITKNFLVCKVVEGMKRLSARKDTRLPITPKVLIKIVEILPAICFNVYEAKLFRAAYSLAFFGFLRVGEFTLSKGNTVSRIIQKSDVRIEPTKRQMYLTIRYSKNDQCGKGVTLCIQSVNSIACPVTCLADFLAVRPNSEGPLFCHLDMSTLSRYQFSAVLFKATKLLGYQNCNFKAHSFRIGAATTAHELGIDQESIQEAGRWKSKVYKSYIRCPITRLFK
jgi:hypothetical protein